MRKILYILLVIVLFISCDRRCITCEQEAEYNLKLKVDYESLPVGLKPEYMDVFFFDKTGNREKYSIEESLLLKIEDGDYNILALSPEVKNINLNTSFNNLYFNIPTIKRNDSLFIENNPLIIYKTSYLTINEPYNEFIIIPGFQYLIDFRYNVYFDSEIQEIEIFSTISNIHSKLDIQNSTVEQEVCFMEFVPDIKSKNLYQKYIHLLSFDQLINIETIISVNGKKESLTKYLIDYLQPNKVTLCEIDIIVKEDEILLGDFEISIVDWIDEDDNLGLIEK